MSKYKFIPTFFNKSFFQLMSAIKTGQVAHSRFDQLAEQNAKTNAYSGKMERSGGGV